MDKITTLPLLKSDQELWSDYVEKSKIAQKTLTLNDGLEARRSWIRFMGVFDNG